MAVAFARGAEAAEFLFDRSNRPVIGLVQALGARIDTSMKRAESATPSPSRSLGPSDTPTLTAAYDDADQALTRRRRAL